MQAIVLAAGAGVRLREAAAVKPLAMVGGRSLIAHVIAGLVAAGVEEVVVVLGYRAALVEEALAPLHAAGLPIKTVVNAGWDGPNGTSVLAAASHVQGRALLTMADHLVEPALYARVAAAGHLRPDVLTLGIDRRLGHGWIDPEDVTRVATAGERITSIGKLLVPFDAYDTGVFSIGPCLFEALREVDRPSLSDGVRLLASAGKAYVADCGDLAWLDVDDPRAYAIACRWFEGTEGRRAAG